MNASTFSRWAAIAALALVCTGCATTGGARSGTDADLPVLKRTDPWENWNRKVYSFNEKLDEAVLKPAATTYTRIVPEPVRRGVTNFFGNFGDAWSAVNNFLQGKMTSGFQDVIRVGTNTVFGLGGFLDVASEFGLDRQGEDLGQTFGRWGAPPGPYIVWPLFGPSTVRDSVALPLDRAVSPALVVNADLARAGVAGLGIVDTRANLLGATRMLDDIALDKYVFTRDAFLQRRLNQVYDGNPPDSEDESGYDEATDGVGATAAAPAASAPASAPAAAASAPR